MNRNFYNRCINYFVQIKQNRMRLFSSVLRRKRGVIFFAAAFMIPLLFVVGASIDTFLKRQKTTRNLLESNLWLSGRSAINQFETQFIELESKWLNDNYFSGLLKNDSLQQIDISPDMFIIDKDFRIIFPETAEDKNNYLLTYNSGWKSDYKESMKKAETEELSNQNYTNAIKNYQSSLGLAETTQQKALAIEGLARSHLSNLNYQQAIRYYKLLKNEFSQIENLGAYPYGISAPLQLYTIGTLIGEDVLGHDSLLLTYQLMRDGHWLINSSSYYFFKAEYESMLKIDIDLKDSRFEKTLKFNQFLRGFVIPPIKERSGFLAFNKDLETKRIYIQSNDDQYLVSFKELRIPDSDTLYFGGLRWKLGTLISQFIPPILAGLTEETGLVFELINSSHINLLTGETAQIPEKSLTLSFSNIPFPFSLNAIQPGYKKLESEAKVQVMIYGLLVVFIIILMFFGVFVLLRDIQRETDSMLVKTEFVHNVSHELKTPLSLIRLYGETLLLKDNLSEAVQKDGLQIITKESERLSYMINNILDFSKIEMGKKEFDLRPGNLIEVVKNTLDSYRYHFVKKGFEIVEEIDQNILIVLFDKNAVEGILINLFSNAIKFSFNTKRMMVSLKNTSEAICLEVSDQGIGIPTDELAHIFDRFYRVKSRTGFEARGSGLGLTLVKHAIDAHGWQIEVKSIPEKGSSFSILIPHHTNKEEQK